MDNVGKFNTENQDETPCNLMFAGAVDYTTLLEFLFDYVELFYNCKRRHSAQYYRITWHLKTPGLSPNQGVRFSGGRSVCRCMDRLEQW